MKKMFLLFFILVFSSNVIAQLYGSYIHIDTIPNTHLSISYQLSLYSGHFYSLDVNLGTDEYSWEQNLSSGTFDMVWDTLVLKDAINGFDMSFQLFEDKTIPIKCISGVVDKVFYPFLSVFDDEYSKITQPYFSIIFNIKLAHTYGCDIGFMLELHENMTYYYYCYGQIVSKGTWKKKRNKLLLQDQNLAKPFIGKIKDGKVILFGDVLDAIK